MLSKDSFIDFILKGQDSAPASTPDAPVESALPEGFEGFDDAPAPDATPHTGASFARRLIEASGFGYAEMVQRENVIRSTDAVARYLPARVSFWAKTPSRPYQTLLFETDLTHKQLLAIQAFKSRKINHLDIVEDALARLVSEALEGFQRGGEGVTADVRKGRKEETLCVVSIIDEREGEPLRLLCFGTQNKTTGGLETFQITEQARFWDSQLAREHLGLLYERQFKKLEGKDWQEAFTTSEERKQAEKLLDICTRKSPGEHDIQEGVLDLLDLIAKGFGLRKKPNTERRLQAFQLPADHDIGIDPEEREKSHAGKNPFGGVTLRDERSRLLGYIVYPLTTKADAERLRKHLLENNRFHNVLVIYPDADRASLDLFQGREQLTGNLRKGQGYKDAADVVNLLSRFFVVSKAKVKNPTELAQELAYRARYLRRLAVKQLEDEPTKGPLRNLYNAFKEALVHDQTEDEFADAFAQTITYGLLTARWAGNDQLVADGERLTRQTALKHLPAASPFLRDLFKSVLSVRLDEQRGRLLWLVDDIADLLDRIDVTYVFGAGDKNSDSATDPVIHFYEPFLAAYDKELKNKRGVFFTPRPVVSYIVRSVHELLQKEFGLEDGLASTDTWGDVAKRLQGLKLPDGVKADDPFVCILDPATGTGTFLFECIEVIERTMKERWRQELDATDLHDPEILMRWQQYVSDHLVPRLYGYEFMMASYAIANLKLSLKLLDTGCNASSSSLQEMHIYLTNSLEQPSSMTDQKLPGILDALAKQAREVSTIKSHKRFTVIVGNPPYSKISSNLSDEMRATVDRYRFVDGERIKEKGALQFEINLQDDYVKFFRLCESIISTSETGVLGFITNNGYLSTPTLRGMRNSILSTFDRIFVLDLHGHIARGETGPNGSAEQNVFDILQGVAVLIACRTPIHAKAKSLDHAGIFGSRLEKYEFLTANNCFSAAHKEVDLIAPLYLFVPHDRGLEHEWNQFASISEVFPKNSAGIITARDGLVIATDRVVLSERMKRFSQSTASEESIYDEFGFQASKRFDLRKAQKDLRRIESFCDPIRHILHRPFDVRSIFYHQSVIWSMSRPIAAHMMHNSNIALIATRQVTRPQFEHAFVSEHMIEIKACSHDRNTQIFPLYLGAMDSELPLSTGLRPNLKPGLLKTMASWIGAKCEAESCEIADNEAVSPRNFFGYVYAILFSPIYRTRYFEFLRSDFPKIPVTPSPEVYWGLSKLGLRLIALHTLKQAVQKNQMGRYQGVVSPVVDKISYSSKTVWLDKRGTCGFRDVPEAVWEFRLGGYQVCEKWLKDRKGEVLLESDIDHYEKILASLESTIEVVREVDCLIDTNGGWPNAFLTQGVGGKK